MCSCRLLGWGSSGGGRWAVVVVLWIFQGRFTKQLKNAGFFRVEFIRGRSFGITRRSRRIGKCVDIDRWNSRFANIMKLNIDIQAQTSNPERISLIPSHQMSGTRIQMFRLIQWICHTFPPTHQLTPSMWEMNQRQRSALFLQRMESKHHSHPDDLKWP